MMRSEAIRELIRLGELSHAYWAKELPRRHPKYPLVQVGEDSGPPPPEEKQIRDLLNTLSERDLYIILSLMYIGRGDFDLGHLRSAYARMREAFPDRTLVIDQMIGTSVLAEYLTDALDEVRERHIDLDSPSFANSTVI